MIPTASTTEEDIDDLWYALRGMALESAPVVGATVLTSNPVEALPDGPSLAECMLAHRIEFSRIAKDARMTIEHANKYLPLHLLDVGDVVYDGRHTFPFEVIRIGYGQMLREIRVRCLDEPKTYEAGRWIHYQHGYLLEIGDALTVTQVVEDSSEDLWVRAGW